MKKFWLAGRPSRWLPWTLMLLVLTAAFSVGIINNDDPPTSEERILSLASTIRCPQCQGETVAESNVQIAADIRADIREQVADGKTDDEIRQVYAELYGDSVLLTPPGEGFGILVWVIPTVAVIVGMALLWVAWRQRRLAVAAEASAASEADLDDGTETVSDAEAEPATLVPAKAAAAPRRPKRAKKLSWQIVAVIVVAALGSTVAGVALARTVGFRSSTSEATGDIDLSSQGLLLEAAELTQAGDLQGAIEAYNQVIEIEADNVIALSYRGWLKWLSQDLAVWQQTEARTSAAPRIQIQDSPEYESRRDRLRQLPSVKDLEDAVRLDPDYPDARVFRGIIFSNAEFWWDAQADFDYLDTLNPSRAVLDLVEETQVRQRIESQISIQDAIAASLDLVALSGGDYDPETTAAAFADFSEPVLTEAALGLADQSFFEAAIVVYSEVLVQNPQNQIALLGRGLLFTLPQFLALPEIYGRGVADLSLVIELDPSSDIARVLRARALVAQGENLELAISDLDFLEANEPSPAIQAQIDAIWQDLNQASITEDTGTTDETG